MRNWKKKTNHRPNQNPQPTKRTEPISLSERFTHTKDPKKIRSGGSTSGSLPTMQNGADFRPAHLPFANVRFAKGIRDQLDELAISEKQGSGVEVRHVHLVIVPSRKAPRAGAGG